MVVAHLTLVAILAQGGEHLFRPQVGAYVPGGLSRGRCGGALRVPFRTVDLLGDHRCTLLLSGSGLQCLLPKQSRLGNHSSGPVGTVGATGLALRQPEEASGSGVQRLQRFLPSQHRGVTPQPSEEDSKSTSSDAHSGQSAERGTRHPSTAWTPLRRSWARSRSYKTPLIGPVWKAIWRQPFNKLRGASKGSEKSPSSPGRCGMAWLKVWWCLMSRIRTCRDLPTNDLSDPSNMHGWNRWGGFARWGWAALPMIRGPPLQPHRWPEPHLFRRPEVSEQLLASPLQRRRRGSWSWVQYSTQPWTRMWCRWKQQRLRPSTKTTARNTGTSPGLTAIPVLISWRRWDRWLQAGRSRSPVLQSSDHMDSVFFGDKRSQGINSTWRLGSGPNVSNLAPPVTTNGIEPGECTALPCSC